MVLVTIELRSTYCVFGVTDWELVKMPYRPIWHWWRFTYRKVHSWWRCRQWRWKLWRILKMFPCSKCTERPHDASKGYALKWIYQKRGLTCNSKFYFGFCVCRPHIFCFRTRLTISTCSRFVPHLVHNWSRGFLAILCLMNFALTRFLTLCLNLSIRRFVSIKISSHFSWQIMNRTHGKIEYCIA